MLHVRRRSNPFSQGNSKLVLGALLGLGFFALYGLFLTRTAYFTRDPLDFYRIIEHGSWAQSFSEAKYVLYLPLARLWYEVWRWFGWTAGSSLPLQLLNAAIGALGVGLFFSTVLNIVSEPWIAVWAACSLGFSYGYWRYALEALTYPLASLFFIMFVRSLVAALSSRSARSFFQLGLVNALLSLFLMSGLTLAIVVFMAMVLYRHSRREKVLHYAIYLGTLLVTYGISVGAIAILILGHRDPLGIFRFLLSDNLTLAAWAGFGQISLLTPLEMLAGLGNLFVGEVFMMDFLATSRWRSVLESAVPQAHIPPLFWAPHNDVQFLVCITLTGLIGVVLFIFFVLIACRRRNLWHRNAPLIGACLVWIAVFSTLDLWRQSANVHNWIPILVPFWLLISLVLHDLALSQVPRKSQWALRILSVILIVALFAVNLYGSILPAHNPNSNWNLRLTRLLQQHATRHDLVISLGAGEFRHAPAYIRYHIGAEVVPASAVILGNHPEHVLEKEIDSRLSQGKSAYIVADVFGSNSGYIHIARAGGLTKEAVSQQLQAFFGRYPKTAVVEEKGVPLVYEIVSEW
jgi:hypothetical protein